MNPEPRDDTRARGDSEVAPNQLGPPDDGVLIGPIEGVLKPPALAWKNGGAPKGIVSTGRPKGSISWARELELAVRTVEKAKKRPFMVHAVQRAYDSDKVLPHVLDRLVPKSEESSAQQPAVVNIINIGASFVDHLD